MERIDEILNYSNPGSWSEMTGDYAGAAVEAELQPWLDANMTWTGAPVSAADIIASEPAFIAWRDGIQQEQTEDAQDAETVKTDPSVRQLLLARPGQIETYIENNVTDLASAKTVLTILAKAVSALGKRELREAG